MFDDNCYTPLMRAVLANNLNLVIYLLVFGANPKIESNGNSIVALAKSKGVDDVIINILISETT